MTPPGDSSKQRLIRSVGLPIAVIAVAGALALTVRPLVAPTGSPEQIPPTGAPDPSPRPPATQPPATAEPTEAPARKTRKKRRPKPQRTEQAPPPAPPVDPRFRPFVGLSTWIDIYDTDLTPRQQIARAAAGGVQLIYVQSARHKSPNDIQDPARLGQVIELAHDRGMLVMVWFVPDFARPARDLRRSQAAIGFRSPRGDRADAFGLDIEVEDQSDLVQRKRNLLNLSRTLREWVGPDYPMAAVVLPPLQLELRADWWPDFPWAELRPYYDVFVPMSYSSYRGTDKKTTYQWNVENVRQMRALVGDETLPVHIAGGIADNFPQVGTFVQAVRDVDALGGGLYDLHTTHPDAWPILAGLRTQQD